MGEDLLLVWSTFPDVETARRIARQLVTENLAACANIVPAVDSIYRWEGKIESAQEALAFFKTTATSYPAFQDRLKALHPYDVPEMICLRIADGLPEYLRWVSANCTSG
ncbi:MAG: divalent-cation tolerance protein CutA [Verrucomicrobia bacterium]|nr:MAG: divalent-cation tolerance protein CutA [Verrucomicrobiota bacterium]